MNKRITFALTENAHQELAKHLFPADHYESIALGLFGVAESDHSIRLMVHKITVVPDILCGVRNEVQITWPTQILADLLIEAKRKNLFVFKIHSHPSGYSHFSETDDRSDNEFWDIKNNWLSDDALIVSLIMLPDKSLIGRIIDGAGLYRNIDTIQVVGDMINFCHYNDNVISFNQSDQKNAQLLGETTVGVLRKIKIGVVGCSGTGSPTIEQLMRLGVGKLVLVDPDVVEHKNLNRIINATINDAEEKIFKIDVFKRLSEALGYNEIVGYSKNVFESKEALKELSTCDVLFGCVDSIDGRHLLNLLSTFYCIPYFDLGVKIIANGFGGIEKICGSVNYIKPGGASLFSRNVYTYEDLAASSMQRVNSEQLAKLVSEKYIKNVSVERPAVISVNMNTASVAVNEFLCRIHKIRDEEMSLFATARLCISDGYLQYDSESEPDKYLDRFVGLGDRIPYLNLPELSFINTHDAEVVI